MIKIQYSTVLIKIGSDSEGPENDDLGDEAEEGESDAGRHPQA